MEKRLMMFIAGLFLSMGVALAQTQVNGTVTSWRIHPCGRHENGHRD